MAATARAGASASCGPCQAVVVASRRNVAPHGLKGGADGAPGRQWVERADGTIDPIPGNTGSAELAAGDALVLETPRWRRLGLPCLRACPHRA